MTRPEARAYRQGPVVRINTDAPDRALTILSDYARGAGANLSLWLADVDPLGAALRRLLADLAR